MQDYSHEENWTNKMEMEMEMEMPASDVSLDPNWGFGGAEVGDEPLNTWRQNNNSALKLHAFGQHVPPGTLDYDTHIIGQYQCPWDSNQTVHYMSTWTQNSNVDFQQNSFEQHATSATTGRDTQILDQYAGGMMYSTPQAMAMIAASAPAPLPLRYHTFQAQAQPQPQAATPGSAPTAPTAACTQPGCQLPFKRDADRIRHEASKHGVYRTLHLCQIRGCSKSYGAGYTRKDKLTEHMWKKHGNLGFVKRVR